MAEPIVVHVTAFPQEMRSNMGTLEEQWIPFFAALEGPVRMIVRTERFDMAQPVQHLERQIRPLNRRAVAFKPLATLIDTWDDMETPPALAAAIDALPTELARDVAALRARYGTDDTPDIWRRVLDRLGQPLWRRNWLQEYRQMYDQLTNQVALRKLEHYMVCWLPDGVNPDHQVLSIEQCFDTSATLTALPPLVTTPYEERYEPFDDTGCYLESQDGQGHLIAMLVAHELQGTWDVQTMEQLLGLDVDLAVCVDVQLVSRLTAEYQTDFTIDKKRNAERFGATNGSVDVKADRKYQAALNLKEILDSQALHDVRVVVAVFGRDRDTLTSNVRQVIAAGGSRLKLLRPPGGQAALTKYFTLIPTKQISAYAPVRREPSHGVAVMAPYGIRKPDRTDGILWMLQGDTPIMFDPIGDGRAGHAVVIGKTGYGKTFASFVWGERLLSLGHQVVLFEPQGHARRFIHSCGRGGARYVLDMRQHINILDIAVGRSDTGAPPSLGEQNMHVINQLAIVMGSSNPTGDGHANFTARRWTNIERALLDKALQVLYKPWAHDLELLPPEKTPTMLDLCDALRDIRHAKGVDLVDELYLNLVEGTMGDTYNHRTSVEWDFSHDATAYDFTNIADGPPRVLYIAQALGALNKYIRSNTRDRKRPLFSIFDEFAYTLGKAPALAQWAADAAKTWRTFRGALITMDQDAHTYLGTEGAVADGPLRSVFDNATMKIIFRQDPTPAERLGAVIHGLQPEHIQRIQSLPTGDCVMVWESDDAKSRHNEVFVGRVVPTDLELRAFRGT